MAHESSNALSYELLLAVSLASGLFAMYHADSGGQGSSALVVCSYVLLLVV